MSAEETSAVSALSVGFSHLSNDGKTEVLRQVLDLCGPDQKWHLQQTLPDFLFRDFFTLLPDEIVEMILSYLDCMTLLRARQVSKLWHDRLSSLPLSCVWQKVANQLGALGHDDDDDDGIRDGMFANAHCWLRGCAFALRLRAQIKSGSCFEDRSLQGLVRGSGGDVQVTAVDVLPEKDIVVAAVSTLNMDEPTDVDSLVIWSEKEADVLTKIKLLSKASIVKCLPDCSVVYCGHNNGTITAYETAAAFKGRGNVCNFVAHTSTVFSVDVSADLKLMASGSADKTVKFWRTTDRSLIKCLSTFNHWVVKLLIYSSNDHQVSRFRDKNLMFSMTKDDISLHAWSSCDELKSMSSCVYLIPLCTGKHGFRDVFFTPGLHLFGDNLGFIKQMPMFETHTIGDADIVIVNANDGQTRRTIHVNKKVRKLLGIGKRFALLLLPYVDNRYKNLAVVDLREKKLIGGYTVPHSRPCTPDLSQIAVGHMGWLDGLSEARIKSKLMLAMATNYEPLHVVSWST